MCDLWLRSRCTTPRLMPYDLDSRLLRLPSESCHSRDSITDQRLQLLFPPVVIVSSLCLHRRDGINNWNNGDTGMLQYLQVVLNFSKGQIKRRDEVRFGKRRKLISLLGGNNKT